MNDRYFAESRDASPVSIDDMKEPKMNLDWSENPSFAAMICGSLLAIKNVDAAQHLVKTCLMEATEFP